MKKILFSLTVLLVFISCSDEKERSNDLKSWIPENSVFIIKSTDLKTFLSKTDSLSLLQDNPHLLDIGVREQLMGLAGYFEGSTIVSFNKDSIGNFNYTYLAKGSREKIETDSLRNKSVKTFKYETFEITQYTLEEINFFTSFREEVLIASNSRTNLEKILTEEKNNDNDVLNKLFSAADPAKTSILINHQLLDTDFENAFPTSLLPVQNLASWSVVDIDLEGENVSFNGISTWTEGEGKLLNKFKELTPQPNLLATVTPANVAGFYSFTYNDFRTLHSNLTERDSTRQIISENHLLNFTREAGLIFTAEEPVLVLTTTDPGLAREAISAENELVEEHRNISIFGLTEDPAIIENLYPLIQEFEINHFAYVDEFIIFSKNPSTLKNIITSYLNKSTLSEQKAYQDAMTNLAGSSSFLLAANSEEFKPKLVETASPEMLSEIEKLDFKNYPIMALQFVAETDFAHVHGVLNTTQTTVSAEGPQQLASIVMDNSNIALKPFLLKNDNTKRIEVALQDENNILYLYSSDGKLKWKKEVEGRILGEIHQVDLFKNGNLQLAFSTQNSFTVLDRNGNSVKPFPISFKDAVTQPLSVFDYDNNRTYRFVITQGRDILMYDSKGSIVKGFGFDKAASEIAQAPQHIRMGNKDYIVFPEKEGKLNILSRQGNQRVKVNSKLDFSENGWYEHKNNFVSVNSEGELLKISEGGAINREKTGFEVAPNLTATENILVLQSENNLKINENTVTLDFGLYTRPQIFEIGGKTFVSITDTQAQKVFAFNEDATLLQGFPVYGTSAVDIFQAQDGSFVLGVLGEENSAMLYSFK